MLEVFNHRPIVVAIGMDDNADSLVRLGAEIAKRLSGSLLLVHVRPSRSPTQLPHALARNSSLAKLVTASTGETDESARNKLDILAKTVVGVDVKTFLLRGGEVEEILLQEADKCNASLIITGTTRDSYRFTPKGISTALSLTADSRIPVVAVPKGFSDHSLYFEKFSLVVADDLEDDCDQLLKFSFNFAVALHCAHVIHVYVHSSTTGLNSAPGAEGIEDLAASMDRTSVDQIIKDILHERSSGYHHQFKSMGINYEARVLSGEVAEKIKELADAVSADFVVFGRHKAVQIKPFRIGQVPFHAMVEGGRPAIVVPT